MNYDIYDPRERNRSRDPKGWEESRPRLNTWFPEMVSARDSLLRLGAISSKDQEVPLRDQSTGNIPEFIVTRDTKRHHIPIFLRLHLG